MLQLRLQHVPLYQHQAEEEEIEEKIEEEHIQDVLAVQDIISAHWYNASAGRHDIDVYIYEYPETVFLTTFRMHCATFC